MKTKEFKKRVEALGWFVENCSEETFVVDYCGNPLALISESERNAMDTNNDALIPDELFTLVIGYARTPIEERKEQLLYGVRNNKGDIKTAEFVVQYETATYGAFKQDDAVRLPTPNKQLADVVAFLSDGEVYEVTE